MSWAVLSSAMQQGFLYALAIYGIAISFRMLNFPDITVDGSFTLGAAVYAVSLVNGRDPWLALLSAGLAGFVAGTGTVVLNRKLGISKLLSGILAMMILYSVNLRVMGQANISLLTTPSVLARLEALGINSPAYLLGLFVVPAAALFLLSYMAMTHLGLFMRATGDNEFMVRGLGVNTDWPVFFGLGLSNMLVAFCGALVAQSQGFADVNMGLGLIITGLAALIIGETVIEGLAVVRRRVVGRRGWNRWSLLPWDTFKQLGAALLGGLFYFLIIGICLRLGLAPTDLKLGTGALVIIGVALRFRRADVETYARARW